MKDDKCPICKTNLPKILITQNPSARFEDYPVLESSKNEYGIICDSPEAQAAYSKIQSFNCWLPNCKNPKNNNLGMLKKHIESHKLRFCNVCLKGRLIFIWEQKCYTQNDMKRHLQYGEEDVPPHRECLFCNSYHYDESDLRSHLESKHYSCNVCEEKNSVYYENYEKLKLHFQKSHYMCHDPTCAENRFAIFRSPYDLQLHTLNFHMDKDRMTKAQKQQFTAIQIMEEEQVRPNTEGVDFSSQFTMKKAQEEVKHHSKSNSKSSKSKNYVVKKKKAVIVDYKTLPKKPEKEVIEMIKEGMGDPSKFEDFKSHTLQFSRGQIGAEALLAKFIELSGPIQGEVLFPVLITTLRSSEKQEELHKEFVKYMESKQNLSADGRCCNQFADCSMDASLFRIVIEVIESELSSRPEGNTRKALFMHPSQLIQMAAIVDKLTAGDMCRFMYLMNFGVTDKAKTAVLNMINRANDREFNEGLQVKYEDYFLKDLDAQHLYVIHKYCEMSLAKLQGRPIKEDMKLLNNWEETKTPQQKVEEDEEAEKNGENGWANVLNKKNAKAPSNIEKNFPSLSAPAAKEAQSWGKPRGFGRDTTPTSLQNSFPSIGETFPSLSDNFPSIGGKTGPSKDEGLFPSFEVVSNPIAPTKEPTGDIQYLIEKGFHVTRNNRGKKKKGK